MFTATPVRRQARHVLPGYPDFAGVRPLEAGDQAQRRRLAAARGAEQREELAVMHLEIELGDRDDVAEPPRHAEQFDRIHQ